MPLSASDVRIAVTPQSRSQPAELERLAYFARQLGKWSHTAGTRRTAVAHGVTAPDHERGHRVTDDPLTRLPSWLTDGQQALEAGRYRDAAAAFAQAAAALPTEWPLHQMTANAWTLAGDVVRARDALRVAFEQARPVDVEGLYALGTALLDSGAAAEARLCFETVAAKRPRDPAALSALASATRADGDPQGAWPLAQRALTLAHKMPALLLTAAQVRHALGDTTGARGYLAKAEKLRPRHAGQQMQLAFSHLIEGASAAGWEAFEARGLPTLPAGARDWHGEPLHGQSIAVVMEQGLGDLFHFVRYVRRLEARGAARVVVECPESAVSLLRRSGFDAVPVGALPPTDWAVPILSLPHRLGSAGDVAGDLVPYLSSADPSGARFPAGVRPRVGLVYKGNPAFRATALRDLPLSAVARLTAATDIDWVWLQYGEPVPAAIANSQKPFETPKLSGNWLDTAALLSGIDVLLSVDTALAHLGGAMSMPVVLMVPQAPDWRWGLGSLTTPWYPSMRLVRQLEPRDWDSAVDRALQAIRDIAKGATARP